MKIFFLINLLFLFSATAYSQVGIPDTKINIGYIEFYPYIYKKEGNQPIGPIVDYIKTIIPKQISIEYIETPLSRVRYSLNSGVIDVYSMYFYSAEREKYLDYIKPSYHRFQPVICNKDKALSVSPDYLKGKTMAHVRGTLFNTTPLTIDNLKKMPIAGLDFQKNALRLLELKRADIIYFPDLAAYEYFSSKNKTPKIYCETVSNTGDSLYLATKKNSNWKEFLSKNIKSSGASFSMK